MAKLATSLIAIEAAVPDSAYSQQEVADWLEIKDERRRRFFEHPHIQKRHLAVSKNDIIERTESLSEAIWRNIRVSSELSRTALERIFASQGIDARSIGLLVTVSTTGFKVPGLTSHLMNELSFRPDCRRIDLMGMGCNAALSVVPLIDSWCRQNPEQFALLVCAEICSAGYCINDSEGAALVNSLFGDGVVVALMRASERQESGVPQFLGHESFHIPETSHLMTFEYNEAAGRFGFHLDKSVPRIIGGQVSLPVKRLLDRFGLGINDVDHWIVHTGGEAVLSGVEQALGLRSSALQISRGVLRDFGNISSGSFLFVLRRLQDSPQSPQKGQTGVMIAMGPGLQIETSLIKWST